MENNKLDLLIIENRDILEKMIKNGVDYSEILKQSEKLDNLISQKIRNCSK